MIRLINLISENAEEPIVDKYFYGEIYLCPSCKKEFCRSHDNYSELNFCSRCGQKINWNKLKNKKESE